MPRPATPAARAPRLRLLALALAALAAGTLAAAAAEPAPDDLATQVAKLKKQIDELSARNAQAEFRVGFVNIVRVFDELEEKIDMNADLRKLESIREQELRDLAKTIKDLTEAIKLLRPESPQHNKQAQRLEEAKRDFRSRRDATEDHLYNKLFDFTHSIYKKIRREIDTYAREAGYTLVLRIRDPEIGNFDQALRPRLKYMELNRRIEYRAVLFSRSASDFTDAIIQRLNQQYLREKAEKKKLQPAAQPSTPPADNK